MTNSDQAESALFGDGGAAAALEGDATVVLCSTVPPDFVRGLEQRLASKTSDARLHQRWSISVQRRRHCFGNEEGNLEEGHGLDRESSIKLRTVRIESGPLR